MCGTVSAVGLEERERALWPYAREALREPGHLMALMRGALGDTEVAVVVAIAADGTVHPVAILTTAAAIAEEISAIGSASAHSAHPHLRPARVGDYDVEVLVDERSGEPVALLSTPWIEQHLLLYSRNLWRRR
jgi:hypothetical protein